MSVLQRVLISPMGDFNNVPQNRQSQKGKAMHLFLCCSPQHYCLSPSFPLCFPRKLQLSPEHVSESPYSAGCLRPEGMTSLMEAYWMYWKVLQASRMQTRPEEAGTRQNWLLDDNCDIAPTETVQNGSAWSQRVPLRTSIHCLIQKWGPIASQFCKTSQKKLDHFCIEELCSQNVFLSTRKRKAGLFKFLRFEKCFQKTPFSWRISVDGRPNRRNKATFSNFSDTGWMGPRTAWMNRTRVDYN